MPRVKPGHTRVDVEMPDEVLAEVKRAAEESGMKLSTWIVAMCARKVKVAYSPPPLGRPAKAEPAANK